MYDHTKQYRCTIIRGKSLKEMDDLLPAYATVIDEICPCSHKDFESLFNNAFQKFLSESDKTKKTLDNHRTEISGKLFGMYFFAKDCMVYASERTQKYLYDNDQPAFFKDICYKMQFPNGMQKISTTVQERLSNSINIRPFAFILKLLIIAEKANIKITKKNLGYYVLNSLDVLQGKASPYEVLEAISADRNASIVRDIYIAGKKNSYTHQHINEQINYLELANLIRVVESEGDKIVCINPHEINTIELFANDYDKKPAFDVYSYNLSDKESRREFQYNWDEYYGRLSKNASEFVTKSDSLIYDPNIQVETNVKNDIDIQKKNLTEFGDEGEALVYEYEKARVSGFNVRLVNKVLSLGKTKGLGYDIQSVIAKAGEEAEFVKYIEVKSTKRLTCPDLKDPLWIDTMNITRNEWVAAQQHKAYYSIFRVFFTREGVYAFIIEDVAEKIKKGTIQVTPTTYRFEFSSDSVNDCVTLKME